MDEAQLPVVSFAEVSKHNRPSDAWIIVNGIAYDITSFKHPGGALVLKPLLGHDATLDFTAHHNTDLLALVAKNRVGRLDQSDAGWHADKAAASRAAAAEGVPPLQKRRAALPPLNRILNTRDMAKAAEAAMEPAGWAYYASAADDERTLAENEAAFARLLLRPRVLINVSHVDARTTLLGAPASFPLYVSATALGKLADPAGEVAISEACAAVGVPYMIPTLGSCSVEEVCSARVGSQTHWFQLYINPIRETTRSLIQRAERAGCSGLFVTVDAPGLGRRERDLRFKAPEKPSVSGGAEHGDASTSSMLNSFIDPSLSWDDLEWLSAQSRMPLVLKGIQTGEDAVLAARRGIKAIVVSNHGGRQVDTCRSGVEALVEVMAALRAEGLAGRMEVFVDGGIRRGTDIFKCLALGASGVGVGRPALHGLAAYGRDGVVRALEMLRDEFQSALRMMGCPRLSDIGPAHLSAAKL